MERKTTIKHWLQIIGASLMLASRGRHWEFDPKTFTAGAVVFACSFLTWKAKKNDDNDDSDDHDIGA